MADNMTVTITGANELIAELEAAITHVVPEATKLIVKGSQNVKKDWQQAWTGIKHAPRIPSSISYDVEGSWRGISSEIGPEDGPDRQGFLGRILEEGGLHNAPRPGGGPALEREEPKLTAAAEALLAKLLP